jgi:tetratricopeptide (TPR) repeat protein
VSLILDQQFLLIHIDTIEGQKQDLLMLYKRAHDADARDPTTLADYGRYVYVRMGNPDQAEPLLLGAIKLNPSCDVALYHLAILMHRFVHVRTYNVLL